MRLSFGTLLLLALLLQLGATSIDCEGGSSKVVPPLDELVARLKFEDRVADESKSNSRTSDFYDVIVAQILSRRDAAAIPLLLDHSNDRTVVHWVDKAESVTGKYRSPLLVSHKVRFILRQMLGDAIAAELLQEDESGLVNIGRAKVWYTQNARRLRARTLDPSWEGHPYPTFELESR